MANWSNLKAAVAKVIKTNGNQEITGAVLQSVLNNIISIVGENASFAGVATPSTNPGTPDGNVFYIAPESGTYSNFGGIVNNGDCLILKKNENSWVSAETGIVTNKKLSDSLGLVIDTSTFVKGQWINNGESLSTNSISSHLRNSAPIPISASPNTIISLYSNTGQRKRIADMGLTFKFRNRSKQSVSHSYVQSGQYIQLSAEASELYIHGTTENINNINGFSFLGFISMKSLAKDIAQNTQGITKNTQDIEELKKNIGYISDYKTTLKILFIGSSFGVDTMNELGNICASFRRDVILGNAYIGASTLQTFISRYDAGYGVTYYKWKYKATKWQIYNGNTGKWFDTDSNITDEGEKPNDSVLLPWLLADEAWDFIILQNGAYQSPYQDQSAFWTKGEDGNITDNIVQNMIDRCKKSCLYSNPVFGMNMTWAFSVYHTISDSHGPSGANDDKWLDYGSNQKQRQMTMWSNIVKNYKDCISNCPDVKFIIPSGTAIQNARTITQLRQSTNYASASPAIPTIQEAEAITDLTAISGTYPFMDNVANWRNKNDFTRDSIHANFGITRYIIAATLFQTFIAKVLNLDIADCTYRIAQGYGNYRDQLCTPVTDDNFNDIVTCVKNAISKPYEIMA